MTKIKILFLAADPSDAARLRLGEELREIREKLQLSKQREHFLIESRESVRPGDITQAIFDIEPQVVHFSGHGTGTGELCFESVLGKSQLVRPVALASLFELVAKQVHCVVLNACYSESQAKAIVKHIPFVIGMSQAIGDKAAIEFATGFYKALGAGYSFEKAYKFGRVEMQLESNEEYLTPILHLKDQSMQDKYSDKAQWMLVLSGTVDDIKKPQAEAIVAHLRQLLNDTSLTLKKIESGSIKLFFEGSEQAFEVLKELFNTGRITEILNFSIQDVTYSAFDPSYLYEVLNQAGIEQSDVISTKDQVPLSVKRVTVFQPVGHITSSNAAKLQQELAEAISSASSTGLLVDMSKVESLDSTGLLALVSALRLAQKLNKRLSLVSLAPSIRLIFELTQLDKVFEILESDSLWKENIVKVAS